MRKGFTMIELIFVIVILGILAAVAIPRLAATRDDAELAKTSTNLATLISDLSSYYTSQGKFEDDIVQMTGVPLVVEDTTKNKGQLSTSTKKCIEVELIGAIATTNAPAYLKVSKGADKTQSICTSLYSISTVDTILKSKLTYMKKDGNNAPVAETLGGDGNENGFGAIAVSGISVKF